MRIAVCMKSVPSTTEVRMDPKTNTIVRDGKKSVLNPFDTAALEVALGLKEQLGAHVTALSMGIPDTERLLRDAISRGADDAVLLSDRAFAGADTLATSYALSLGLEAMGAQGEGSGRAGAASSERPGREPGWPQARGGRVAAGARPQAPVDLVLCGKMAVDGDTAQIGPELAGLLGVPCVTGVIRIEEASEHRLVVWHDTDEGACLVEVPLPCVLTVAKDIAELRMPSIAGVRAGEQGQVTVLDAASSGADLARCGLSGSPTQVVRSFVPERASEAVEIAGEATQVSRALVSVFEEALR